MDIKKGQRLEPTDPTQRTRHHEYAHARFDSYTGARREVKRGGEAVPIGEVLKPLMRRIVATERRSHFRLILGGKFPDAHRLV